MGRKVLLVSDGLVLTREICEEHFGFMRDYGFDIDHVDDFKDAPDGYIMELMILTEQNAPETFPANKEIVREIADAEVLIVHMSVINKTIIDAGKNLKVIGVCRGGCDNVNVEYAHSKGITIVNAASRSSDAVADTTVAIMIGLVKNLFTGAIQMRKGDWSKKFCNPSNNRNMVNLKIGLIGYGTIGSRVQKRCEGFGSKVMVHDPFISDDKLRSLGADPVSLEVLLKEADLVSMHLRLSDATTGFLGKKELEMMKPTAYLVNTARAGLIAEEALLDTLQNRKICAAALDVFNEEPLPLDHPYFKLDNVVLTPHLAGTSADTMLNSYLLMAEEMKRYCKDEPFQSIVHHI